MQLVLLATLLFSVKSILIKLAYTENVSVIDLLYYRFLFAVPLLWAFAIYTKRKDCFYSIKDKKVLINCIIAGLFGYYITTLADSMSLKLINANLNRIIVYTFPIYVLLWHSLLQKTLPNKTEILCFSLVQLSLYFVLSGFNVELMQVNKLGIALAFLAAISYSFYIILNQQTSKHIGSILFTTYSITIAFIFISIHYFAYNKLGLTNSISGKGYFIILIISIFCTFLPVLLVTEGIKRIGASRFSLLNSSGPIITILLCYVVLDETMTYAQIAGSLSVIGILYYSERKTKTPKYSVLK